MKRVKGHKITYHKRGANDAFWIGHLRVRVALPGVLCYKKKYGEDVARKPPAYSGGSGAGVGEAGPRKGVRVMEKLSCLYSGLHPTHDQLVAHLTSVRRESGGERINHQIRIAAESAPGACRAAFVKAAAEVGYHPNTAGKQFNVSRDLSREMWFEDNDFIGPPSILEIGRRLQ